MAGDPLQIFPMGAFLLGIKVRLSDFQTQLSMAEGSLNLSQGIYQGLTPRPGTAPIPGQAATVTSFVPALPNLTTSELINTVGLDPIGYSKRLKVYAILPFKFGGWNNPTKLDTYYLWIFADSDGFIDAVLNSTAISSFYVHNNDITNGFPLSSVNLANLTVLTSSSSACDPMVEMIPSAANKTQGLDTLLGDGAQYYLSATMFSSTGSNYPMKWAITTTQVAPTAGKGPKVTHWGVGGFTTTGTLLDVRGLAANHNFGVPTEYNEGNFNPSLRHLTLFGLDSHGVCTANYSAAFIPTTAIFLDQYNAFTSGQATLDLSGTSVTTNTGGAGGTAGTFLVNDPACITNNSYSAVLIANKKKAIVGIFQDYMSNTLGTVTQWFDVTNQVLAPKTYATAYTENAVATSSSFNRWHSFIPGTASDQLLGANTGILRSNTVYEITYSIYNKRLGFETNVGAPVKVQTGTDDFDSLWVGFFSGAHPTWSQYHYALVNDANGAVLPYPSTLFGNIVNTAERGELLYLNYMEYRFYYRQLGTFEWLPAGNYDAAQYWFYPQDLNTADPTYFAICAGAVSGLPGGQPGGFQDYSPLPADTYDCVLQYKNRAWWFSGQTIYFSLENNIFAYPGRNSIAATSGLWRGGIVHNYPGQAEQSSRLVIFGSTNTYVARFSGTKAQAAVQIAPDPSFGSAVFDIDGSDLVIDPWTSFTAFSYRAAVVAEGLLYYWGPQGVFRDDGVATPTKISMEDLEPDIFDLYDPNSIDETFAHYNTMTKEITWFYNPKVADAYPTHGLTFNLMTGEFLFMGYTEKVDWGEDLNIEGSQGCLGQRAIIGTRATAASTVQRAYFHDQKNRAGEQAPGADISITAVSTPAAGQRRLTLGTGAGPLASVNVGDTITIESALNYATTMTVADNMIATVIAKNVGTPSIDILLPTGANMDASASLTVTTAFPIWHLGANNTQGLNGIPWAFESCYWMPADVEASFWWEYLYFLFKAILYPSPTRQKFTLQYKSPTAPSLLADSFSITNNSDLNCQIFKRLSLGDENMEGQALKFVLSGIHNGNQWVLQYGKAYCRTIDGEPLMRFLE